MEARMSVGIWGVDCWGKERQMDRWIEGRKWVNGWKDRRDDGEWVGGGKKVREIDGWKGR